MSMAAQSMSRILWAEIWAKLGFSKVNIFYKGGGAKFSMTEKILAQGVKGS